MDLDHFVFESFGLDKIIHIIILIIDGQFKNKIKNASTCTKDDVCITNIKLKIVWFLNFTNFFP